jgi:hypothetical protein
LASLTQLISLNLSNCKSLVDVSALGSLTQLTSLDLSDCTSLVDVSALSSLTQLTSLDLSDCTSLVDVSALSSLTQLTSLDLSECGSLSDVSALGSLTQLTSLDLSGCGSLSDVSALGSLTQLNSLNLGDIFVLGTDTLNDISALTSLTQLTSLDLSDRNSIRDISAIGSLTQLTSLNLSSCESVSDITVLSCLMQLTSLNLSKCKLLSDVSVLGNLTQLTSLNLSGCHRITKEPNFKELSKLEELEIDKHPWFIADILAHCAYSRQDWKTIQENIQMWLDELGLAIQNYHPTAIELAISLANGAPHIENQAFTFRLLEILHKGSSLPHQPWKHLLHGTLEIIGFPALVELARQLPKGDWTSGAIGGLCSIVPMLRSIPEGLSWVRDFIQSTHRRHHGNPGYLRPVAAQWCLALDQLAEGQLLQEWLELLTDPADSKALDSIYFQFAKQALATGDPEKALKLSLQIQGPKRRDELLLELADHHLQRGEASQAGGLLFLVSHPESRSSLAKNLAAVPGYLDAPTNLHRILAAFGSDGEAIRLLSDKISVEKLVQALPREELRDLLLIECMKMVSRGLGISEAEAKQVLIQEVQKNSSIRNIHL